MKKLSVIIPTFIQKNMSIDRLLLTIKGYALQSLSKDDFELVIVDDGSIINVKDVVEDRFGTNSNIRIHRQEHTGMCTAINTGVEIVSSENVLIAVDDNIPHRDALKIALEAIDKDERTKVYMGNEPFLNFVTGMNELIDFSYFKGINEIEYRKKYQKELSEFDSIGFDDVENKFDKLLSFTEVIDVNKCFIDFLKDMKLKENHWLCIRPGSLILKRDFMIEIGGMDTELDPVGWYSDLDLGYRIIRNGGTIGYLPDMIFIHLNHIRINAIPRIEADSHKYLISKHNTIEMILLPLLWHGSDLNTYVKLIDRAKKYITLKE